MDEADKVIKIVKIVKLVVTILSIKKNEEHSITRTPKNRVREFY